MCHRWWSSKISRSRSGSSGSGSEDDTTHVIIEDNGAGVEDAKLVLKPFHRADKPRSLDAVSIVALGIFLGLIGSSNQVHAYKTIQDDKNHLQFYDDIRPQKSMFFDDLELIVKPRFGLLP